MAHQHPTDDEIADEAVVSAQDICIETAGRLAEFWGFTRTMGRVYASLYLSPRPMTQADIVERLGVSAANVSMSLKGLIRWGAVHKVYEKGSRKLHYAAEAEIRTIIRNVLGGREQRELLEAQSSMADAAAALAEYTEARHHIDDDARFILERVEHLESSIRLSNKLLKLLLGEGRVDVNAELTDSRLDRSEESMEVSS